MRASRTLIVLTTVVLVMGGGGAGWWWTHRTPAAVAAAAGPRPPGITEKQVQTITTALNDDDPAVVRTALAVPPGQPLDPALVPGLQALRPIAIDAATLAPLDSGTLQADAHVGAAGDRTTWHVFLTQVDGVWKLAATTPAS